VTQSADISVRPARIEDLETLVEFSDAMAMETEGRTLDRPRLRLGTQAVFDSPSRGFYLVAEQRDPALVVGQLLITFEWSDWRNATFWWIQSVYVKPDSRRRGVYRRLHQDVIRRAKADGGICGVRLYVEQHNTVAQAAYEHVGLQRAAYVVCEDDFVLPARPSIP
jgi:ribosomal protein S18 acetylase RimI-like enzyme